MYMKILLIILLSLSIGCQDSQPDIEECNQLARETYKGLPKAASRFKKYCLDKQLSWSPERCKEVFQRVVLKTPKKMLIEKYGEEFLECLSENDMQKFGSYLLENK